MFTLFLSAKMLISQPFQNSNWILVFSDLSIILSSGAYANSTLDMLVHLNTVHQTPPMLNLW